MGKLIVLHYYATGPGQELYSYLVSKGEMAALLELPFSFSQRKEAVLSIYRDGKESKVTFPAPKGPFLWRCLRELSLTGKIFAYLEKNGFEIETCIGNGFFDTLVALRRKIKNVILYTIDYAPNAYPSYLRWLYKKLDAYAAKRVTAVWNLSPRMQEARGNIPCKKILTVPHGTHFEKLKILRHAPQNQSALVFMGHLKEDSGVDLAIKSLLELRKNFPKVTLTIVGGGPEEENLKALANSLGLLDCVKFLGFINDHTELEKILCNQAIGLALYNPYKDLFSKNADPGKVKVYLGCGLPVLITDVPAVAKEIQDSGAGEIVNYNVSSFAFGLGKILLDYQKFRSQAEALGARYDWNKVFAEALSKTFEL